MWSSLTDSHNRARLLAVSSPHCGVWLQALFVASCETRLENEAIRVAIGLRLEVNLCEPHVFLLDIGGCQGLTRSILQAQRMLWRALSRASIPSVRKPANLSRSDGRRPDGLRLIPWRGGKYLTWDVTVADTLAATYLVSARTTAGSVAEEAASRKDNKYSAIAQSHVFVPLAIETLGQINFKGLRFLSEMGGRSLNCCQR